MTETRTRAPRWAVAMVLAFGATSALALGSIAWRDAETRALLAHVRTALERTSFAAQARFSCVIKGEPVQVAMVLEHWHDAPGGPRTRTRDVQVVEASAEMRRWFELFARHPGGASWGWRPDRLPLDEERVLDNYWVRVQDAAPRDGRTMVEIAIAPRRPFRPRAALLVDRATGVPLELSLYSHTGALEHAGQLASVRMGAPDGPPPTDAPFALRKPIDRATALAICPGLLEPRVLPAGYALAGYYSHEHPPWRGGDRRHGRGRPGSGSDSPPGSGSDREPERPAPSPRKSSVRIEYGDGLARLFLVQLDGDAPKPPHDKPSSHGGKDRAPRPASRQILRGDLAIDVDELGGRAMARARIGTVRVMIAGMASPDELADCLASMMPDPADPSATSAEGR